MFDTMMLAIGVASFAAFLAYVTLCERMWAMGFDYILGAAVSLVILVYLVYALVRPEKF
jgi:K+-transporting ATPase KdpF subunit